MKHKGLFFLLLLMSVSFACSDTDKQTSVNESFLRTSRGDVNELLLIMDSAKWNGALGEQIKAILQRPVNGLTTEEPQFDIRWIDPLRLNDLLKSHHCQFYVTSLESKSAATNRLKSLYSEKSLQKLKESDKVFYLPLKNKFAKPQHIVQLFGRTDAELINNLKKHDKRILKDVEDHMRNEAYRETFKKKRAKGVEKTLSELYGFNNLIPYGYDLARHEKVDDKCMAFVRNVSPNLDYNLLLYKEDYTNEAQADSSYLLTLIDSVGKNFLYDVDKPELYVQREVLVPTSFKRVDFNGKYAWEARGWWETSLPSMGGAYVAYLVVDDKSSKVHLLMGFLYAPNKTKRNRLQQLETTIWQTKF